MATDDTSHPIGLTPPLRNVRTKCNTDTLGRVSELSCNRFKIYSDLPSYWALVLVVPGDQSTKAIHVYQLCNHRRETRPVLRTSPITEPKLINSTARMTSRLTHQALLPGLPSNTLNFPNLVESNAIFAEETTVHDKVSLLAFR